MAAPRPLRQESDDTCTLACLRMILAMHGVEATEAELASQCTMQAGGVDIEDLRKLALAFGLNASTIQLNLDGITRWLQQDVFPIVYLNRVYFERRLPIRSRALRDAVVHAVIPVAVSRRLVSFNDPLRGKLRRISHSKFAAAQADLIAGV